MQLAKPERGELIATLPIFQRINPLARPRLNYHSKTVYQPKQNQVALLADIQNFSPLEIADPIIVDTYINFEAKGKSSHPVSKQFGDDDNLRKAIADALQSAKIIKDDRLIVGGENYKAFGSEDCCLVKIYHVKGETHVGVQT
jgi:Holliday junction resolvase RusA-like endonuclease